MCNHVSATAVTGGKLTIYQCDVCGAPLWWRDVPSDVQPAALDVEAIKMWEERADAAVIRDMARLDLLMATNPQAFRAELRKAVAPRPALSPSNGEIFMLILDGEDRLSIIREVNGEIAW
mgnify:CR=1 FL=1